MFGDQSLDLIDGTPKVLAIPSPNCGSALKKFLIALSLISKGTGLICPDKFLIVFNLAFSSITFLNKIPGWVKSSFGWLGLCLATNPVTLYG